MEGGFVGALAGTAVRIGTSAARAAATAARVAAAKAAAAARAAAAKAAAAIRAAPSNALAGIRAAPGIMYRNPINTALTTAGIGATVYDVVSTNQRNAAQDAQDAAVAAELEKAKADAAADELDFLADKERNDKENERLKKEAQAAIDRQNEAARLMEEATRQFLADQALLRNQGASTGATTEQDILSLLGDPYVPPPSSNRIYDPPLVYDPPPPSTPVYVPPPPSTPVYVPPPVVPPPTTQPGRGRRRGAGVKGGSSVSRNEYGNLVFDSDPSMDLESRKKAWAETDARAARIAEAAAAAAAAARVWEAERTAEMLRRVAAAAALAAAPAPPPPRRPISKLLPGKGRRRGGAKNEAAILKLLSGGCRPPPDEEVPTVRRDRDEFRPIIDYAEGYGPGGRLYPDSMYDSNGKFRRINLSDREAHLKAVVAEAARAEAAGDAPIYPVYVAPPPPPQTPKQPISKLLPPNYILPGVPSLPRPGPAPPRVPAPPRLPAPFLPRPGPYLPPPPPRFGTLPVLQARRRGGAKGEKAILKLLNSM